MNSYIDGFDIIDVDPYELLQQYDFNDTVSLLYDVWENCFIDASFGHVVFDIHRYLAPWQITLFKRSRESMVFIDVTNSVLVALTYPDYLGVRHS